MSALFRQKSFGWAKSPPLNIEGWISKQFAQHNHTRLAGPFHDRKTSSKRPRLDLFINSWLRDSGLRLDGCKKNPPPHRKAQEQIKCLRRPPQPPLAHRRQSRSRRSRPRPTPRRAGHHRTRRRRRYWLRVPRKAVISMRKLSFLRRPKVRQSAPRAGGFGGFYGLSLPCFCLPSSSKGGSMRTMLKLVCSRDPFADKCHVRS